MSGLERLSMLIGGNWVQAGDGAVFKLSLIHI